MLQKSIGVNSYVIYYCHEFLMKTFDKMLFGYMVLKGDESPLTFRIPKNLYQYTRHIRKLEAVVQKTEITTYLERMQS